MADTTTYNASPSPTTGTGAFGMVPGQISMPNPYQDLSNIYPNLGGTNQALGNTILSQLSGNLSPQTQMQLQNYAAAFGAGQGQGTGSNADFGTFSNLYGAEQLGKTSEQLQQQGISNYNQTIPTISSTQTVSPALQAEISNINAINAAAPNPMLAQQYSENLFNQYLDKMMGPEWLQTLNQVKQGVGDVGSIVGTVGALGFL